MRFISLCIFLFTPLLMVINTIYAIANSKIMAIVNLSIIGLLAVVVAYVMWADLGLDDKSKTTH